MPKALQFWGISFFLLFALSQLLDWLQQADLPFPLFVMTGVGLAAFSNYDKRKTFPLWSRLKLGENDRHPPL
ncbi:MAG: hypothetical protein ACO3EZ_06130 [Prochlorotrichaceae cyanobacterium]